MKVKGDPRFFCGGIWSTADVAVQPVIILSRWKIMAIAEGPREGERHVVGFNEEDGEGRVSTSIIDIDMEIGQCLTESGRVYTLVGPTGYDPDGEYVWQFWLAANDISAARDVSAEYEVTAGPS